MMCKPVSTALLTLAALLSSGHAQAQDVGFQQPYWTERPVIEAIGVSNMEFQPNRASFTVAFEETNDDAEEACRAAADEARRGVQAMRARVPEGLRVSSQLQVNALYEQYRERDGTRVDNERADRITGYVARVSLTVSIEDEAGLTNASEARAAVMAAGPQNTSPLSFRLSPTPQMRQQVYEAAVADAAARARAAAAATNQRLGALLVAQDGQGPCLGQWNDNPQATMQSGRTASMIPNDLSPPTEVFDEIVVTATRRGNAITVADIAALNLPADPPPQTLSSSVCLVYAIGG